MEHLYHLKKFSNALSRSLLITKICMYTFGIRCLKNHALNCGISVRKTRAEACIKVFELTDVDS